MALNAPFLIVIGLNVGSAQLPDSFLLRPDSSNSLRNRLILFLCEAVHTERKPTGQFGLIGDRENLRQQRLARRSRPCPAPDMVDVDEAEPSLRPELIFEKFVKRGEVTNRRNDLELGAETHLEGIHERPRLDVKIPFEIRAYERGAESPQAVRKLQLGTLVRGSLPQCGGDEQKMTHRFIREGSFGATET